MTCSYVTIPSYKDCPFCKIPLIDDGYGINQIKIDDNIFDKLVKHCKNNSLGYKISKTMNFQTRKNKCLNCSFTQTYQDYQLGKDEIIKLKYKIHNYTITIRLNQKNNSPTNFREVKIKKNYSLTTNLLNRFKYKNINNQLWNRIIDYCACYFIDLNNIDPNEMLVILHLIDDICN